MTCRTRLIYTVIVMPIKLFNTLTRKAEIFKPIRFDEVRIYTCGPTVYDFAHIGNFRSYIFADILRRWLEYRGFKVTQVMNISFRRPSFKATVA